MDHNMTVKIDGIDVTTYGLKPLRIPPRVYPTERTRTHNIPGRLEPLIERTGEYDLLTLPVEFFFYGDDPDVAVAALMAATRLEFGRTPDWSYPCSVIDRVEIPRWIMKSWNKFTVRFVCSPFMRETVPTKITTTTGTLSVGANKGDRPGLPVIRLEVPLAAGGVRDVTVTVSGHGQILLSGIAANANRIYQIDSEARAVSDDIGGVWTHHMWGGFPELTGNETVQSSISRFEVEPHWRKL